MCVPQSNCPHFTNSHRIYLSLSEVKTYTNHQGEQCQPLKHYNRDIMEVELHINKMTSSHPQLNVYLAVKSNDTYF